MAKNIVEPRTLPGFMELLPEDQIEFDRIKDAAEYFEKSFRAMMEGLIKE